MPRAVDVVRQVAPRARPSYVTAFDQGDALLLAHGITTRVRLGHFLAQVLHELILQTIRTDGRNAREPLAELGEDAGAQDGLEALDLAGGGAVVRGCEDEEEQKRGEGDGEVVEEGDRIV